MDTTKIDLETLCHTDLDRDLLRSLPNGSATISLFKVLSFLGQRGAVQDHKDLVKEKYNTDGFAYIIYMGQGEPPLRLLKYKGMGRHTFGLLQQYLRARELI